MKCFEVVYQSYMVRCFPCALDFTQSNNTFYGITAFFEHNFSLAPWWKINYLIGRFQGSESIQQNATQNIGRNA